MKITLAALAVFFLGIGALLGSIQESEAQVIVCARQRHGVPYGCRPRMAPRSVYRSHQSDGYYRRNDRHWRQGQGRVYGGEHYATNTQHQSVTTHRRLVRRSVAPNCAPSISSAYVMPTPAHIASRVPHRTTYACVPCVQSYTQNPKTCECSRVTWHPGPPPQ